MRLTLFLALFALPLAGAEGKWTPDQVLELDAGWLKQQGLELDPSRLWDAGRGTGLLSAAVRIGTCSGAFVSPDGLILTNHHCLFAAVQQHSTAANDLITKGYLARDRKDELPAKNLRVAIPRRFTDVTAQVEAAVPNGASGRQRFDAIEAKQKQLVAECEKRPGARCSVAVFDGGVRYILIDTEELADVRLVYAPPRAVGEYGGETDNWMWPRHTGDFAIARAYVAGAPYHPEFHFPVSTAGVAPGDFVMVLGYPGRTYRSLVAAEMEERRDLFYPRRVEVIGEWIKILEQVIKDSEEGRIRVAANLKSLYNVWKNAEGQIAGFARGRLLEKQRAAEDAVTLWAETRPVYRGALQARRGLIDLAAEQRKTWEADFLLKAIPSGSKALYHATTLVRAAEERQKADRERDPDYMDRELPRLRDRLEREEKNYFEPADKALFLAWVRRARALGREQRIAAVDAAFARDPEAAIARMYAGTKVLLLTERLKMLDETAAQLRARRDPLLEFAFQLAGAIEDLKQRENRWDGIAAGLRPVWRRAVMAHAAEPIAPDANATLRVSFAHIQGYEPRDGVLYKPQTTLSGVVEKHTGQEPFAVPEKVLAAARAGRFGRWKDAGLNDVPVCFLADADTTGGNSGSPTVNGRGELVGLNFDRVWENVANDFGYNPAIARNVNVDIRYLLWMLEQVENADELLRELTPGSAR